MSSEATSQAEQLPYINENGLLIIPTDAPERYHFWKPNGMQLAKILAELNAPPEIVVRYTKQAE